MPKLESDPIEGNFYYPRGYLGGVRQDLGNSFKQVFIHKAMGIGLSQIDGYGEIYWEILFDYGSNDWVPLDTMGGLVFHYVEQLGEVMIIAQSWVQANCQLVANNGFPSYQWKTDDYKELT